MMYHNSVLLNESVDFLSIRPDGTYVDATYGGGGHTRAILDRLTSGRVIAFDQDAEAIQNRIDDPRLIMVNNNFRFLRNFLMLHRALPVDGVMADLGISSHQIDQPERGFSTRFEGALDMRMDQRKGLTAREVVNKYGEEKLSDLFRVYGEIQNARRLASLLVVNRKNNSIETTTELKEIAQNCAMRGKENKYLAQVFQALRIEVNQEIDALKELLVQASDCLKPGGRLVVIAYHSLEDKLVKNFFRSGNFEGRIEKDFFGNILAPLHMVTRRAMVSPAGEIEKNSRSRSARLRVAEKK